MQPSTHQVGFTAYEVVSDDIKEPLTSNQLYQSQYNEFVKFKLVQFNVVPDDLKEPLLANQMRQSQYDEIQRGWLRMNNGQGLVLQGSDTDQEIFKEKLSYGLSHSEVFRKVFTKIANNPAQNVHVDIGRNQPNVLHSKPRTSAVFIGQLKVLGAKPKFRSGRFPAIQTLTFEVKFIETGDLSPGELINVLVTIVEGSRFVVVNAQGVPALNQTIFEVGRTFRVFVNKIGEQWQILTNEGSIEPVSLKPSRVVTLTGKSEAKPIPMTVH